MYNDAADFVKKCDLYQKRGELTFKTKNELICLPVPSAVMKQIFKIVRGEVNLGQIGSYGGQFFIRIDL